MYCSLHESAAASCCALSTYAAPTHAFHCVCRVSGVLNLNPDKVHQPGCSDTSSVTFITLLRLDLYSVARKLLVFLSDSSPMAHKA